MERTRACTLGRVLTGLERYEEAERYIKRSVEIVDHSKGPHYPSLSEVLGSLVHLYQAMGRDDEARKVVERMGTGSATQP